MPSHDETVLIVTDSPAVQAACESADGVYLGLDDRGRQVYRLPAAALDFGEGAGCTAARGLGF